MSATEETPLLLSGNGEGRRRRPGLVSGGDEERTGVDVSLFAILSFAGFVSTWAFWTYYVDWRVILLLLGVPTTAQSAFGDVSLFLAATLGVLFASVYSTKIGNRSMVLYATALIAVGSVLVATAQGLTWLLLGRLVQTLGTTPVWSLAIGALADGCGKEVRGRAVGGFAFVTLLGAGSAPFASYLTKNHISPLLSISQYSAWRLTQGILAAAAVLAWVLVRQFVVPDYGYESVEGHEFEHVGGRESDSVPESEVLHGGSEHGEGGATAAEPRTLGHVERDILESRGQRRPWWARVPGPFKPFALLKGRDVLLLSFASGLPLWSALTLLWTEVSLYLWPYELGSTEQIVFRRFLPVGAVSVGAGALLAGLTSDLLTSHTRHESLGSRVSQVWKRIPQDRFFVGVPGGILVSISTIAIGFVLKYATGDGNVGGVVVGSAAGAGSWAPKVPVDGDVNYALVLVLFGVAGFGTYSVFIPAILYFLDVAPRERRVQILAANDALQILASFIAFSVYLVLAQAFGSAVANVVAGVGAAGSSLLVAFVVARNLTQAREGGHGDGELVDGSEDLA